MKTFAKILTYFGIIMGLLTLMSFGFIQSWQQGVLLILSALFFYIGNNLWTEILNEEEVANEDEFQRIRQENLNKFIDSIRIKK